MNFKFKFLMPRNGAADPRLGLARRGLAGARAVTVLRVGFAGVTRTLSVWRPTVRRRAARGGFRVCHLRTGPQPGSESRSKSTARVKSESDTPGRS